jgi:hypothetical protein
MCTGSRASSETDDDGALHTPAAPGPPLAAKEWRVARAAPVDLQFVCAPAAQEDA